LVRRKEEYPKRGELVIGTVSKVNPYSAFVSLDEYGGKEGMVHVSEVARKWVRDIRTWVKKGDKVVCFVKNVDPEKGHIDLSMKMVSDEQKNRRLQEWKKDQRGEKLLEMLGKEKGKTLDEMYKELGFLIQENFRNMMEPFELVLKKGEDALERRGIPEKWIKDIKRVAEENITIKEIKLKGYLRIKDYNPDGIERIKDVLKKVREKHGVEVKYIHAPLYEISFTTQDPKSGEKKLREAGEFACSLLKDNCECEFSREEFKEM